CTLSSILLHPPKSTLFPYTTLFRSRLQSCARFNEKCHARDTFDITWRLYLLLIYTRRIQYSSTAWYRVRFLHSATSRSSDYTLCSSLRFAASSDQCPG